MTASGAPLLATSGQTTTGFTPLPVADLGPTAKLLLIASMLGGGSLGSTAGGVKLLRVLIALRLIQWAVMRARPSLTLAFRVSSIFLDSSSRVPSMS